jgi:hypothetical protein
MQAALDSVDDSELLSRADIRATLVPEPNGERWFDFIADTGDGFDSTYSVAWLQAQSALRIDGQDTRRGRLLLLGGDQVYPDPSLKNYSERFHIPFGWAMPDDESPEDGRPLLYAIPGNHDWYDGLDLFLAFFCAKKPWKIGMWRARQLRSYFALRITDDLWVWGVDIQLSEFVDSPQADYFRKIAAVMPRSSSIIICTAVPGWYAPKSRSFDSLGYFSKIAREAKTDLRVPLVLSGDIHHYSRYVAEDGTQFVTAGGGGAFLHPTHTLRFRTGAFWSGKSQWLSLASFSDSERSSTPACYPSMERSRKLTFGNLLFPLKNWKFAGILGSLYALAGLTALMWSDFDGIGNIITNPIWLIWLGLFVGIFYFYADDTEWTRKGTRVPWPQSARLRKFSLGGIHGLSHVAAFTIISHSTYNLLIDIYHLPFWSWGFNSVFVATAFLSGAVIGGFLFGLYLLLTCLMLCVHADHAFSSMSLNSHRNFVRLKYKNGRLTLYPVGIDQVPKRCEWVPRTTEKSNSLVVPRNGIAVKLIEPPIELTIR